MTNLVSLVSMAIQLFISSKHKMTVKNKKHSAKREETAEEFLEKAYDNSAELMLESKAAKHLQGLLATLFSKMGENQKKSQKIVFENYGPDQIWNQMQHHTASFTTRSLLKLEKLIQDDTLTN